MRVVVCIPYRPGDPHRARAWDYVRTWWAGSGWPVSVAPGPGGTMNRAAARNEAARRAGAWDVAFFADADTVGDAEAVGRAVAVADNGRLAYPYTVLLALDPAGTRNLLRGTGPLTTEKVKRLSPGGILAVGRELFERVGGYDEEFRGWGYEDLAFAWAASTLGGEHRIEGAIMHLWHPIALEKRNAIHGRTPNRARRDRYAAAAGDPAAMTALLAERCSLRS